MSKLEDLLPGMYREMHAAGAFVGNSWRLYFDEFKSFLYNTGLHHDGPDYQRILDFGCGPTGGLQQHFSDVVAYDPYVEKYADDPWKQPFDVFFSSDVFEHLPLGELRQLVRRLCKHATIQKIFVVISTRSANKFLPNGTNAHLTVRSAQWWHGFFDAQLGLHYDIVYARADMLAETCLFGFTRIKEETWPDYARLSYRRVR